MELMKLNQIYVELRGDSWFDSEKEFNRELKDAMTHCMPNWLLAQATQLIDELYELDRGNKDNEECFFMIDMEFFRQGMYDAHREIMKNHNAAELAELAALDILDGDDETEIDFDAILG